MAEMKEIKVDGVCEQETTKGNQLIDFASIGSISCDVKFKNDTLEITSNKSYSRASKNITELLRNNAGKVLNFTFERIDFSKSLSGRIQLNILKNDGTSLYQGLVESSGKKVSYTIPNDFSDITSIVIEIYSNNTSENSDTKLTILKPLLYFENNNSYEPYTGGQPSPNPEYPQEIKTITDSLKVTSCGKNLINSSAPSINILGVSFTNNGNGTYTISGTIPANNNINLSVTTSKPILQKEKTYTQVVETISGTKIGSIVPSFIKQNGSVIYNYFTDNQTRIPAERLVNNAYNYYYSGAETEINWTFRVMLCEGSNATYEDYIESQVQAKLPEGEFIGKIDDTYKDTLRTEYFPKEGQYHLMLDKKIGKYVLNGSEYWDGGNYASNNPNYIYLFTNANSSNMSNVNLNGLSVHFKPISKSGIISISSSINYDCFSNNSNDNDKIRIMIHKDKISDLSSKFTRIASFRTWLSNNNDTQYFVLKTPYTLDLGAIDMPMSYKDITNIFTDSDLLPTINAKYYRVFDKTIQNAQINEKTLKQEITDLNATVSALDTRLKALETKSVEEPTESEVTV